MKIAVGVMIVFACIGFSSCNKQIPQLPANKIVEDNSDAQALLAINENLTAKEDSLLEIYVAKTDKKLRRNELGFWYKVARPGSKLKIEEEKTCNFSYKLSLLNGKLVDQGKKQVKIGKKEIVVGLEEGLKLIHHGDSALFVIPWYLGYGMKGEKSLVPAYTSIIYEIKVE